MNKGSPPTYTNPVQRQGSAGARGVRYLGVRCRFSSHDASCICREYSPRGSPYDLITLHRGAVGENHPWRLV